MVLIFLFFFLFLFSSLLLLNTGKPNCQNMMTAPDFFGNAYAVYHGPATENLRARESPLDLQTTNKRNCEASHSPIRSPPR